MSKSNGQHPVFNFGKVSYGWAREFMRVQMRMNKAAETNDIEMADAALDDRDKLIVQPLVSVPDSWLVEDAPKTVNWGDPKSLEYLQAPKVKALMDALTEAQQDDAKN